jgi:hypothetical protein
MPVPPGGRRSARFRVRVDGADVFVEAFRDVAYARFEMDSPCAVEFEAVGGRAMGRVEAFPASRISDLDVEGGVMRLVLPMPGAVVITIRGLGRLFLLAHPVVEPARSPRGEIDPREVGADPTGRRQSTAALQAALDRARDGGHVVLRDGRYRTGTLRIPGGATLEVAAGAVLQGSRDPADYPLDPGTRESHDDESLPPDARFLGRTMTFSRLLLVDAAADVRITGRGTIDGAGTHLRTRRHAAPNMLRVRASERVVVEDVLFRDAAAWSLHVLASRDVAFRNVKLINDRRVLNTDGIDVDMSTDVSIDGAFIFTKDDGICVKATRNGGYEGDPARIRASGCLVSSVDAALKVGTESDAARFSDIRFEACDVFDSGRAMSVVVRDGAAYERITFSGIRVGPRVRHLVEQVIGVRDPDADLGSIRDLRFEHVTVPEYAPPAGAWTWYAQFRPTRPTAGEDVPVFEGADPAHAVDGLRFRDVVVNGTRLADAATAARVAGLTIGDHVRDVSFD